MQVFSRAFTGIARRSGGRGGIPAADRFVSGLPSLLARSARVKRGSHGKARRCCRCGIPGLGGRSGSFESTDENGKKEEVAYTDAHRFECEQADGTYGVFLLRTAKFDVSEPPFDVDTLKRGEQVRLHLSINFRDSETLGGVASARVLRVDRLDEKVIPASWPPRLREVGHGSRCANAPSTSGARG